MKSRSTRKFCIPFNDSEFLKSIRPSTYLLKKLGICCMLVTLSLTACKTSGDDSDDVVVQVYDSKLHRSELLEKMPEYFVQADSARIADQIINNWIRDKTLLQMADENLPEEQKDVQKQLDEYRNSLIIYAYERALVGQKLDTIVSDEEIKAYFEKNIQSFKLRSYIIKLRFVKLSNDAPKQARLEKWFLSDDEDDFENLYDYCRNYAENYFLEEEKWLYLEDILKEVPVPTDDLDNFLKRNKHFIFQSGDYTYYVRFFDYKLKDDTAPLALERQRVRDLILNKRKAELILQMREDVVRDAYAQGKIKKYTL